MISKVEESKARIFQDWENHIGSNHSRRLMQIPDPEESEKPHSRGGKTQSRGGKKLECTGGINLQSLKDAYYA